MKTAKHATKSGVGEAAHARQFNDLLSSVTSHHEVAGGDTTLVIVDMQQIFLRNFGARLEPLVDAIVRQVKHAKQMGWAIVLLEMKPWKFGETIAPIIELLDGPQGKYPRFTRRMKQTQSGAKELLQVCHENGFGMGLFRFVGVFLEACVLDTAVELLDLDQIALVRLMEEGCATDLVGPEAWDAVSGWIGSNLRTAISSEKIDGK